VLKFFAVRYGLRLAPGILQVVRASARRKTLRTFAKKFLMHAHKPSAKYQYVDKLARLIEPFIDTDLLWLTRERYCV
jgi:hypothetical protein